MQANIPAAMRGDECCHIGNAMTSRQGKSVSSLEPSQDTTLAARGVGYTSSRPLCIRSSTVGAGRLSSHITMWAETAHSQGKQQGLSGLHAYLTAFLLPCDTEGNVVLWTWQF